MSMNLCYHAFKLFANVNLSETCNCLDIKSISYLVIHQCTVIVPICQMHSKSRTLPLTKHQVKRYCDILGIPITASERKIKQSFYKKSFLVHPDRNKNRSSKREFTEISDAYKALLAHKKLSSHDEHSPLWQKRANSAHVRPWFRSNMQKKPFSSKFESADDFEDEISSSNSNVKEGGSDAKSSATDWCNNYYQRQLKQDYIQHTKSKEKSEKESNNTCTIM